MMIGVGDDIGALLCILGQANSHMLQRHKKGGKKAFMDSSTELSPGTSKEAVGGGEGARTQATHTPGQHTYSLSWWTLLMTCMACQWCCPVCTQPKLLINYVAQRFRLWSSWHQHPLVPSTGFYLCLLLNQIYTCTHTGACTHLTR